MLLTIATERSPARDLGYLLHKRPDRVQTFDLSFGKAHVFYPQADNHRCEAALLLDVDRVGMVRGKGESQAGLLDQYVNDRPYVASSFLSVAIAQVYGSAMGGRCKDRPELVGEPMSLEATIEVLPVRGGEPSLRRLFEPLGYELALKRHLLDVTFPEWGGSPYFSVKLTGTTTLSRLLTHLYVLMPVFDERKHYFVGDPRAHSLMYVVGPAAFERLKADPNVTDPLTAPDSLVALYADYYFEYDEDRRVTKEMIQGGSQTYLFSYSESAFADHWNQWKYKTVETLPDGNQNVVYMNYAGRSMLEVFKSGSDEWATFYEYDENGRVVLRANPSAVTGYDEGEPDLLNFNVGTGKYQYLRDSDGLVRTFTYHAPSGNLASESLQEGQLGTSIKLREMEYVACGCGGGSSSSSSSSSGSSGASGAGNVWFTAKETVYPSDVDPSDKNVTTYAYTFHPGSCQVQEIVTTLPAIPTTQNGSGVAATRRDYFDVYGRNTWRMNERGFIDRMKPDVVTGALVQSIQDVDTGIETDAPSGWTTPSGGGLNLVTDYEFDDRGRMTQSLGPIHPIDLAGVATAIRRAQWIVYDESGAFDVPCSRQLPVVQRRSLRFSLWRSAHAIR